eukprot:9451256-Karenia_brevis.AAC.1
MCKHADFTPTDYSTLNQAKSRSTLRAVMWTTRPFHEPKGNQGIRLSLMQVDNMLGLILESLSGASVMRTVL